MTAQGLKGRIVLITGAARGTGRAMTEALVRSQAQVVMVDSDPKGREVAAELKGEDGRVEFLQADLADQNQVEGIVPFVVAKYGGIDVLINNSVRCPIKALVEMEQAEFDMVMQVNFRSAAFLIRKSAVAMMGRRRGTILNILSTAGAKAPEVGSPYLGACAASKGALAALTLSVAPELAASGISCMGLWVGLTRTPGGEQVLRSLAERLHMRYEDFERGLVPPEMVAGAVVHIISDPAPFSGTNNDLARVLSVMQQQPIPMPAAAMAMQAQLQQMAPVPSSGDGLAETISRAHDRSTAVVGSVNATLASISQLPDFYQPTSKKDFAQRVGESLDDLAAQVRQFDLWLNNLEAAWRRKDESSVSVLGGKVVAMYAQREATLRRYAQYLRETAQSGTALFNDPRQAQAFRDSRTGQASSVESFCDALQALQEGLVKHLSK